MDIRQNIVPKTKWNNLCPHSMTPKGITLHNTANDASADAEARNVINNSTSTGFHIVVDDIEAVQIIPDNRNAWHAGDGNGAGNREHIGIEICYSKSGGSRFQKAEANAVDIVAKKCLEYGWGVDRIKPHKFFSGKNCPHRTDINCFRQAVNIRMTELRPKPEPQPQPEPGVFYRVIAGSYKNKENADALCAELRAKGYSAFIDIFKK